jgi:hypothetical protein
MSENIQNKLKKKKTNFSSEEEFRDLINMAASKSLKQFIQRIDTGEIPVDNMSDFVRILSVYKEINGISEAMEGSGGSATLPELSMKQDKVLEDKVGEGVISVSDEGLLDVEDMSNEDVAELIRQLDIAQNNANEGTF